MQHQLGKEERRGKKRVWTPEEGKSNVVDLQTASEDESEPSDLGSEPQDLNLTSDMSPFPLEEM